MTTPADLISLDLVPNADDDDPKDLARGMAALIASAEELGTRIKELAPIEADANKNSERAANIRETTNPQLIRAAARFRKQEKIKEVTLADGTIQRYVTRDVEVGAELEVTLKELYDLCTSGISTGFSLASKLVSWVYKQVPSRKR